MTDIPAAREMIQASIGKLEPFEAFPEIAEVRAELTNALAMMTRVCVKPPVRRGIEITDQHRDEVRMIRVQGLHKSMTCAEIATKVFGEPVNLGWVSDELKRKAA